MKNTYKLILGIIVLVTCFNTELFSRQIYNLNKHVVQPEKSSFSAYDKPQVDGQGNLNISITLGTIPGRGMDFPVTLSYQSGIKVIQPSSWVGLGWSYNPGTITRSPSIGPVTAKNIGSHSSDNLNGVDVFDASGNNWAPDKFIVSIPGQGGTEMVQIKEPNYVSNTIPQYKTGDFLTLEHKAWKIEFKKAKLTIDGIKTGMRSAENSGSYDSKVNEKDFSKFLITTEDGTRYLFGSPTLSYVDVNQYNSGNNSSYIKRQDYVSTWRLIAIMGTDYNYDPWVKPSGNESGVWVKFDYGTVYTDSDHPYKLSFRQTQYLEKISTPAGSAVFETASRIEPMLQAWEKDFTWEQSPDYYTNNTQRKLTNVVFYNSGLVKTINFIQDNTFNPMPSGSSGKGRMKLKGIEIKGSQGGSLPGYKFEYVDNPTIMWPYGKYYHEMTTCMDEFGYINFSELGWTNNTFSNFCASQYSVPSNPNSGANSWSLSSIEYPTGLVDKIEYETRSVKGSTELDYYVRAELSADTYKPDFNALATEDVYVAGPSVSVITRHSGLFEFVTDEEYREEYSYGDGTMLSGIPDGYFRRKLYGGSSNRIFAGSNAEATINYGSVTIDYYKAGDIDGTSAWVATLRNFFKISQPRTTLFYSGNSQCPDPVLLAQNDMPSTPTCKAGYVWTGNEDWTIGRKKGSYYVTRGTESYKLEKNVTSYSTDYAGTSDEGPTNHIWTLTDEHPYPYTQVVKSIGLRQQALRISSKTTTDGDNNSSITYTYDKATNLIAQQRKLGTGQFRVKNIKRASSVYNAMKARNMLTQIAREDVGIEKNGSVTWKRGKVTTWKDTGIDTDPLLWKPWKTFSWKAEQAWAGTPVSFNEWSSGTTPTGWIFEKEMKQYDLHGNLLELELPNSTTVNYSYGLNSSKLMYAGLEEGGSSNPITLSVSVWYANPFTKVSRVRDQHGVNTYYDYDEHGRLEAIKNHHHKLISSYKYNYGLNFAYSNHFILNRVLETKYTNPADTSDNVTSYLYYDGMARLRQTVTEAEGGYLISQNDYGPRGFLEKQWKPYLDQNVSNGAFIPPSTARSRAAQYYKSKLGLSYTPHPYTRKKYYGISVPRVMQTYPAWTNAEDSVQFKYGLTAVNGISTRYKQTIDEAGKKARVFTNYLGEQVRQIIAEGTSIQMNTDFEYDEAGNLVTSISPRGLETTYEYNTLGQLTHKKLPDQDAPVDYKYDKMGNLRFTRDANHKAMELDTSISFSAGVSFTKTIEAPSKGTAKVYVCVADLYMDSYDITLKRVDNGNAVIDSWVITTSGSGGCIGGPGNPLTYEVAAGTYQLVGQARDPGEPIISTMGEFGFTSYEVFTYTKYDRLGRPTETGEYDGGLPFAAANPDNEDFPTTGHQANIQYYYDGVQKYSGSQNLKGRLSKVHYRDLSTTSGWGQTYYSYNKLGLVSKTWQEISGNYTQHILDYSYDELGRTTQIDYREMDLGNQFHWRYSYDELGRLSTVKTSRYGSAWIKDAEYSSYAADGQVQQMKLGNSAAQTVDYSYTIQGWIGRINNPEAIGNDKFAMKLNYSSNGNVTRQQWRQPGLNNDLATYAYSYDGADRLLGATFSGSGYNSNAFKLYYVQYDKDGNIKRYIRNNPLGGAGATGYMTMQMHSNSNRIAYLEEGGNYARFDTDYDANGNMTTNELNGLESAQYDWRNLPSQLIGNAVTMQYAYDGDGNRTKKKKVGGTEIHYVRGAGGQALAVYKNDNLTYQNIIAGGEIIGNHDGTQRRYFLKDHLGSIRTTVNQNGSVDGYDDYYPFGLTMPGRSSNSGNPNDNYKFTGHELDDEANLNIYYMIARGYDPVLGRFMQVDPALEYSSSYTYVGNNPLKLIDPTGMYSRDPREGVERARAEIVSDDPECPEEPCDASNRPNYHKISDTQKGMAIIGSIISASSAGKKSLDVNDIFDFYNETYSKNYGPAPDGNVGTVELIARDLKFGSFSGNVQIWFATILNKVNDKRYSELNISGIGYPESNIKQFKVDGLGNILIPKVQTYYRYATFDAKAHYVFRMRVIKGSQQDFYDSFIKHLR
jgi:RHS repeat-associated protein